MKSVLFALAGSVLLGACAPAEDAPEAINSEANEARLAEVLAHERRDEDRARDTFRNPGETLAFFQVNPEHSVIEYAPGGGWYTRILAPYVSESGSYTAVTFDPEAARESLGDDFVARLQTGIASFSEGASELTGVAADQLPIHLGNAVPAELNGTVDRVLIIRMMHNLLRWGIADRNIDALAATLKPDGMIGIVQHRAKAGASDEFADGNRGYLKQADLIAYFESKGFELVDSSEINANPKDPADHEGGVWTLPPSNGHAPEDAEKYAAIGESDRMTLLFKKAE